MNTSFCDKNNTIILIKNNEYITINYYNIDVIKKIIPSTKIHINELSKYTKILTNAGYKCYYINNFSKL